jgi:hypothetical protein
LHPLPGCRAHHPLFPAGRSVWDFLPPAELLTKSGSWAMVRYVIYCHDGGESGSYFALELAGPVTRGAPAGLSKGNPRLRIAGQ